MSYDCVIIGGGIVGVSTAWQLKKRFPDLKLLLLEKERRLAGHQTGHNSGVIHAGVYYQPGSLKAQFCRQGAKETIAFCKAHDLPFEQCGKLLVATDDLELSRMADLETHCRQNLIDVLRLSRQELLTREPAISGAGALFVPATGITDYGKITNRMAQLFTVLGGEVRLKSTVLSIREEDTCVRIGLGSETVTSRSVLVCGGLMANRLARMMRIDIDFSIIPFRGEYYRLPAYHDQIVNHLIYPIPDPDLPFLGVHLTRMIDGYVTVGPNAVLGWKREGYGYLNFDPADVAEMVFFPGFWKVIKSNLKTGLEEIRDSFYLPGYLKRVQKYCPQVALADLRPHPTGIRAQAVLSNGSLVHDFLFVQSQRSLHVCNAPSPAATSAIPIGGHLCQMAAEKFNF